MLRVGPLDPAYHRSGDFEHPYGQVLQIKGNRSYTIGLLVTDIVIYYTLLIKESSILGSPFCLSVTAKTLYV